MDKLQRFILKNEKVFTTISGISIGIGFIFRRIIEGGLTIGNGFLILATINAMLPIGIKAWSALKARVFSIELLVTVAVIGALFINEYVESSVVTFLFLFGSYLEARSLNKTRESIKALTELAPEEAEVLQEDGTTEIVDVYDVEIGDTIIIKQGGKIPVDGHVLTGDGRVNQATITGESVPIHKQPSQLEEESILYAGTILESGYLTMRADKLGEDSTFAKIIELVEEAQDSKSDTEQFLDRFSQYYTPAIIIFATLVYLVTRDLHLAITILVIACPGALVIGAPVSNVAGIGNGAKNGVLLKGGQVMQNLSEVDTLVFDKTGTLTKGKPEVTEVLYYEDTISEDDKRYILTMAREVEAVSEHHLGTSIINYAKAQNALGTLETAELKAIKARGVIGLVDNKEVFIGNKQLAEESGVTVKGSTYNKAVLLEKKGNTVVYMGIDKKLVAVFAISDKIRDDAKEALANMRKMGIKEVVMLTGDNKHTAQAVGEKLNIDKVYAELKPEDKVEYVKRLKSEGKIISMAGDGVNDAPAIATAHVGLAMGDGGTDIAIETADLVLMKDSLMQYAHAYGLSKKTMSNMKQNIFIALAVVVVLLAGVLFGVVNMSIGMFVHEASILVVIFNAMRLNKYKLQ